VPDAIDLFVSGLEATRLETEGPKLVLPSFTLDITALSQTSLAHVHEIFSHCILEKLVVKCHPIDLNMSERVAKVIDSVHWSLLEHLWLSGDNINQWIQLLAKFNMPRLKTLQIRGTKLVWQELSHASVLSVERLIVTNSLTELYFNDVLLRDQRDWLHLVETMDPSMLGGFGLGDGSYEQFMSTSNAMDLICSKLPQLEEHSAVDDSEDE
jgi:hypothetical protein